MGASVGEAHGSVVVEVQLADHVEVAIGVVEQWPIQQAAAVVAEHGAESQRSSRHATLHGCRRQRGRRIGLVVKLAFDDEHAVHRLEDQLAERPEIEFFVGEHRRSDRRIAKGGDAVSEVVTQALQVRRRQQQRMRRELHAHQHADRAACHLRGELGAVVVLDGDARESFAPDVGQRFSLVEVDGDATTAAPR